MGDGFHISILWLSLRMSENCQVLAVRNIASLNFNKQTEPRMMETSRKTKFIQEKKKVRCSLLLAVVGSKHSRLLGLFGSYLWTMCVQYPRRPQEGHQHSQELEL